MKISIHALREEGDPLASASNNCFGIFLSTPSARRATELCGVIFERSHISIHALREEGDTVKFRQATQRRYFYPRPPRGGRLTRQCWPTGSNEISIHALREEGDPRVDGAERHRRYFYPRPPRGGRPMFAPTDMCSTIFLSTPSARRATPQHRRFYNARTISIHALREEGDRRCM